VIVATTDEDLVVLHVVAVNLQDTRAAGGHEVLVDLEVLEDPILDHLLLEDSDRLSIENARDLLVQEEEKIVLEVHLQRKIDRKVCWI